MSEQNKRLQLLSQEEVAYTPVSIRRGEACAACRWYGHGYCHLVMSEPQAIEPTGYCNRFEAAPVPEAVDVNIMVDGDVTVVQMEERQSKEGNNRPGEPASSEASENKPGGSWLGAIKNWFVGGDADLAQGVFKALGDGYWLAAHTNNLQDLEGEILTEKAHKRYIARVQQGFVEMPELWLKHIKGTRHGKALWMWMDGHMVGAVGKFDDTPMGHAMEKYYRKLKPADIQLSHGFSFPKWGKKGTEYEDYNTFEITTIPVKYGRGANPYTAFEEVMTMALSAADRKMLEEILPADIAPRVVEWNDKQAGKLKELVDAGGVAFKGLFDFVDTTDKADKPADGDAQKAMGSLLSDLVDGQATTLDEATKAVKAVAALVERMEKRDKEWQAKLTVEQEARKALEARLDGKPRRVDDADAGNQVEGKEAEKATEELDAMKGEELDPHYPGMGVKKA